MEHAHQPTNSAVEPYQAYKEAFNGIMLRNIDYKYDKIDYLYHFLPCILKFQ